MTRYVVIGAGAIGATLAVELQAAGRAVVLVARGAQLAELRTAGLRYVRPDDTRVVELPVVGGPDELELRGDDVLVLATKAQDAEAALAAWAWRPVKRVDGATAAAATTLPVLVLQNGLDTERVALRRFTTVLGAAIWSPAVFVTPGEVVLPTGPVAGVLWLGRYPAGSDPRAAEITAGIADDLRAARHLVEVVPDVRRWKAAKLLPILGNVLDALYRTSPLRERAAVLLREEALAVYAAAGEDPADVRTETGLDLSSFEVLPVPGHGDTGRSTWQSLARGASPESDFLNGEIALLGRLHGVATPHNAAVLARVHRAVADAVAPGSLGDDDLRTTLPELGVLIDLAELRATTRQPVLLDVRWALGDPHGHDHYREAHLPGAVYVDLDTELAAAPVPERGRHPLPAVADLQRAARSWGITAGRPVVVYDDNGGLSAARAWWLLRWAGIADVRLLDGGLGAWRAAGFPVESGEPAPPAPGDVVLSSGHLPVLDADQAAALARDGVLLDARAPERYRGEVEPIDSRAGHIPGARSAPTGENLDSSGRFRSAGELAERFGGVGDRTVGVYCGSGVTAAHEIAALAVAGIDAALYPGSWSAWSSDPSRPVAVGPEPGVDR